LESVIEKLRGKERLQKYMGSFTKRHSRGERNLPPALEKKKDTEQNSINSTQGTLQATVFGGTFLKLVIKKPRGEGHGGGGKRVRENCLKSSDPLTG